MARMCGRPACHGVPRVELIDSRGDDYARTRPRRSARRVVDRMLRVRLEALPLQMHQRVGRGERPGGTQLSF